MILSKKKQPQPDVNIKIEGKPIEEVDRTKFLGTIIDNQLSWKHHIPYIYIYISGKVARGIGIKKKKTFKEGIIVELVLLIHIP